ncbi:ribosome maturation factor RimP [Ottowia thiooxydans]|uniref:Ribosome maturation factor RimP n=1 Tax=Ottowia thiooxydans TaxID=219182 RepID=A0ABV2Q1N5_9BURK
MTSVALQQTIDDTVRGLGFEPVETERSAGGLLRVSIDLPWNPSDTVVHSITVEDCERVTRQLQYVLEVEGVDYKRLEVSSPGIDRPLRNELDFERFQGQVVDLVLKAPLGVAAAAGQVNANRKKFRGTLQRAEPAGWQIIWSDEVVVKPGQRVSAKRAPPPVHVMAFALDELQSARLAPMVDFKGRGQSSLEAPENEKD